MYRLVIFILPKMQKVNLTQTISCCNTTWSLYILKELQIILSFLFYFFKSTFPILSTFSQATPLMIAVIKKKDHFVMQYLYSLKCLVYTDG